MGSAAVEQWVDGPAASGGWVDGRVPAPAPEKESYLGGLYASTVGPLAQAAHHPIDALEGMAKAAIGTEDLNEIARLVKSGDYKQAALRVGKWAHEGPAGRAAHGIVDPVVMDLQQENYAGAGGRLTGAALTLGLPVAAETEAGGAALNAVKSGAQTAARAVARSADVIDPSVTGVFSPRLANFQRVLIRAGQATAPEEGAIMPAPSPAVRPPLPNSPTPPTATAPVWRRYAPGTSSPLVNAYETAPEATPPMWPRTPAAESAPTVEAAPQITREVLDSIAAQMGYRKGFASVPADGQQVIKNLAEAALKRPPRAQVDAAPPQPVPVTAAAAPGPQLVPSPATLRSASVADIQRQLAEEMLKSGNATPEMLGDPTAIEEAPPPQPKPKVTPIRDMKTAMRDLPPGAPKAIADANYAADQDPVQAGAVYEAAGRAAKAQNLSRMLYDEGMTVRKVSKWDSDAWAAAAKDRGMPRFSIESQGEVIDALKKLEKKVK